jgi:hypothetical protein
MVVEDLSIDRKDIADQRDYRNFLQILHTGAALDPDSYFDADNRSTVIAEQPTECALRCHMSPADIQTRLSQILERYGSASTAIETLIEPRRIGSPPSRDSWTEPPDKLGAAVGPRVRPVGHVEPSSRGVGERTRIRYRKLHDD